MSRYIIMFKGGVETQEFFSIEMAHTFEANGYSVYWFDLITSEQSAHLLRAFYEQNSDKEFIAVTFNYNGIAGEDGLYESFYSTGNFWDETQIPIINIVVDHPLYYHHFLAIRPKKYVQISIDRNHIKYMNRFFPEVNKDLDTGKTFIPLGGTGINVNGEVLPDKRYFSIKERPIDVIFTGNYTPIERFDRYLANMDVDSRQYYKSLVREAVNAPDSLIEVLNEVKLRKELFMDEKCLDEDLKLMQPNLMYVDLSVRFYYRAKVIKALADSGIKVHTFGAGWNLLECEHPENIITAGSVDSRECLDKISQSKISVNVMPWFKDGAHDRIFNSMLNGAVCVSDDSRYLREILCDKEDILFYSLKNTDEVAELVCEGLNNPENLQRIADKAYDKALKAHTWKSRVERILELMSEVIA